MSPELLDPLCFGFSGRSTRGSDRDTLGVVVFEVSRMQSSQRSFIYPSQVLTGLRSFHHLWVYLPVPAVLKGERPEKPLEAEFLGFSCILWELV